MSVGNSGSLNPSNSDQPKITNITVVNTNEFSYTFTDIRKFSIKCRTAARIQLSYIENETDTKYWTNGLGGIYREEFTKTVDSLTIYMKLDRPNRVVEILEWT